MTRRVLIAVVLFAAVAASPLRAAEDEHRPVELGILLTLSRSSADPSKAWLVVRGVAPGTPAERAGIHAGDLILEIGGQPIAFKNDLDGFSVLPTTMHDSVAGDPMWLVTEHGDGNSIDVVKMDNVLTSSAAFTTTNLAVTPYQGALPPLWQRWWFITLVMLTLGLAVTTIYHYRVRRLIELERVRTRIAASRMCALSLTGRDGGSIRSGPGWRGC